MVEHDCYNRNMPHFHIKFQGIIPMNARDLDEALEMGMDWSLREGYVWPEDKEHCEEYGRMLNGNILI